MANIYEPAALIADKHARDYSRAHQAMWAEICRDVALAIRALPNPPSEVPVFTAEWLQECEQRWTQTSIRRSFANYITNAINARLATLRPAPASEPDLERMQEALDRAHKAYVASKNFPKELFISSRPNHVKAAGAKYLAAEGFRLGNTSPEIESKSDGPCALEKGTKE